MLRAREDLSPREREQFDHESAMFDKQAAQVLAVKTLERETKLAELRMRAEQADASRQSNERIKQAELDIARLDAKLNNLYKIPLSIVRLPLYIVLGIAYCIAVARDHEPSADFWRLLR